MKIHDPWLIRIENQRNQMLLVNTPIYLRADRAITCTFRGGSAFTCDPYAPVELEDPPNELDDDCDGWWMRRLWSVVCVAVNRRISAPATVSLSRRAWCAAVSRPVRLLKTVALKTIVGLPRWLRWLCRKITGERCDHAPSGILALIVHNAPSVLRVKAVNSARPVFGRRLFTMPRAFCGCELRRMCSTFRRGDLRRMCSTFRR